MQTTTARNAAVVLMGLALAGCPGAEALYGVADTTAEPPVTSDTTMGTESETDDSTGGSETAGSSSSGGTTGSTTADTGTGSSTGTGSDGTVGSSSLGEPEYGVPETTSG